VRVSSADRVIVSVPNRADGTLPQEGDQVNVGWSATAAVVLPGVTMRRPEATYLAWLDCSALDLPMPAGQFFLDRARVGLNFGETFGAEYAAFARLNFATPAPILREIVGRMAEAVRRR